MVKSLSQSTDQNPKGFLFQNLSFWPRIPFAIDASRFAPTKEKIIKYLKTVFPKRANGQSIALGEVVEIWPRRNSSMLLLNVSAELWDIVTKEYRKDLRAKNVAEGKPEDAEDPQLRCNTPWTYRPFCEGADLEFEEVGQPLFSLPDCSSNAWIMCIRLSPRSLVAFS